jgi:hypothetical protein
MDAGSRPARPPGGISGGNREAAIFLPGAGIVKGAATSTLNTFTGIAVSEWQYTESERNPSLDLHIL